MTAKNIGQITAALVTACLNAQFVLSAEPTPSPYLRMARNSLSHCDYKGAVRAASREISLQPNDADAYIVRAIALTRMDSPSQGLDDFAKGLKLNPKLANLDLYDERYRAFIGQGQLLQAAGDLSKGVELRPKESWRYKERGQVYGLMKHYQPALADLTVAIKLAPKDSLLYLNRGHIYAADKQYAKALTDYTKVIALKPDDPMAYGCRAGIYEKLGKPDLARQDKEKSDIFGGSQM